MVEKVNRPPLTAIQVEVARAYCKAHGKAGEASEELGLNASTVRYHMRLIREATGIDHTQWEGRKELKKLIGEYSKWLIS